MTDQRRNAEHREQQRRMAADHTYFAGPNRGFPANAKGFLAAPVIWLVWFVALYSVQGAGCATGLDAVALAGASTLRLVLAAMTVVTVVSIASVGLWSFMAWERLRGVKDTGDEPVEQSEFMAYAALLNALLFLVASLWTGIPILMADDLCHP